MTYCKKVTLLLPEQKCICLYLASDLSRATCCHLIIRTKLPRREHLTEPTHQAFKALGPLLARQGSPSEKLPAKEKKVPTLGPVARAKLWSRSASLHKTHLYFHSCLPFPTRAKVAPSILSGPSQQTDPAQCFRFVSLTFVPCAFATARNLPDVWFHHAHTL